MLVKHAESERQRSGCCQSECNGGCCVGDFVDDFADSEQDLFFFDPLKSYIPQEAMSM